MRLSKTETIDGLEITVQQLPAMRATKLWHKLVRAIGPALLRSLSGADDTKVVAASGLSALKMTDLADGVQVMFDRLSAQDTEEVIRELFETAHIKLNGNLIPLMPVFDDVMAGKIVTVLKATKFALEVNYQDFFGMLLRAAVTENPKESKSKKSTSKLGAATDS